MKVLECMFLAKAVSNRSINLVMINAPKNDADRKKMTPYAKVGRLGGQSIRGWIRFGLERLLIENGVSPCHPLAENSITGSRNKEYFKEDSSAGYHPRASCASNGNGGCLVFKLFGHLNAPGNLLTSGVFFYPTTTGNGTATKDINRFFGDVGSGRVDIIQSSPRKRKGSHQVYLTTQTLVATMVRAPLKLVFHTPDPNQEIVVLKTLDYINQKVKDCEYDFLFAGLRNQGYGFAGIVPIIEKKSKKNKVKDSQDESDDEASSSENHKLQFKRTKKEASELNAEFARIMEEERKKFPLKEVSE